MKNHQYIAIGCSHTRAKHSDAKKRWTHIVQEKTGALFEFRHLTRAGSGLVHLECRCNNYLSELRHNVDFLVIQKPQPIRFPWWIKDWKKLISKSRYQHRDLIRGRIFSMKEFVKLSSKEQNRIAELIYKEELECLIRLKEFFPQTTKIAYYHYWGDFITEILHRKSLSHINTKLGEEVEKIGIENWDMIIDPHSIPGVYDGDDIILNVDEIYNQGWSWLPGDLHPGPMFYALVADKVVSWMDRTTPPLLGDNSLT